MLALQDEKSGIANACGRLPWFFVLVFVVVWSSGCTTPTITPTQTPTLTLMDTPSPTYTLTPTLTETHTPTPTPTYTPSPVPTVTEVPLPATATAIPISELNGLVDPEEIPLDKIVTPLLLLKERQLGKPPVPADRFDIEALRRSLEAYVPDVIPPLDLEYWAALEYAEDAFNLARATTYALPDSGTLFQLVSLNSDLAQDIDRLLHDPREWEGPLFIGSLVVYQPLSNPERDIFPGIYSVLLWGEGLYVLVGDNGEVYEGQWRLHALSRGVKDPYAFVVEKQICFSQIEMQACLDFPVLFGEQATEIAARAVTDMLRNKLLPTAGNVNVAGAFADIQGAEEIRYCADTLWKNEAGECRPNYVVAAASPFLNIFDRSPAIAFGVVVMEVLAPMEGPIVDGEGNVVTLEPGSYRLDVLSVEDEIFIGQLVSVDLSLYYIWLEPAEGKGQWIDLEAGEPILEAPRAAYMFLDVIIFTYCVPEVPVIIIPSPPCNDPEEYRTAFCIFGCN
ncbi:MAG: hypothetical protein JXA33_04045 [Anaerolineae bacterium]|nr:hypothetical protein [Anaerolineae bacterium]